MISNNEIFCIGQLLKPHGICGEITALITHDIDFDSITTIVVEIDGINVPFFLKSTRPKSSNIELLTIEGIENEQQAAELCNRDLCILLKDMPADAESDGLYASDLVGYDTFINGKHFGRILRLDDSTANYLFIIEREGEDGTVMIPAADEFISELDAPGRRIKFEVPDELLSL